jgi:hypothetical protein
VKNDGTLICWSSGLDGTPAPPAPPTTDSFRQVSVGDYHFCGLKTDGSIVCWGSNQYGQLAPAPPAPAVDVRPTTTSPTATPLVGPGPTDPPMDPTPDLPDDPTPDLPDDPSAMPAPPVAYTPAG